MSRTRFRPIPCCVLSALLCGACSGPDKPSATEVADTAVAEADAIASDVRPEYPAPPYGINEGDTFPLMTLRGRVAGATEFIEISSRDYFDPDGSRGIRAVWVVVNTFCKACEDTNPFIELPTVTASSYSSGPWSFGDRGARMLDVIGHVTGGVVKDSDVNEWITRFKSTHDVAIHAEPDPLSPDGELPHCFTVDPRTMKIVYHQKDALKCKSALAGKVEKLLVANGAAPIDAGT